MTLKTIKKVGTQTGRFKLKINYLKKELYITFPKDCEYEDRQNWIEKCMIIKHLLKDFTFIKPISASSKNMRYNTVRINQKINNQWVVLHTVDFNDNTLHKGIL